MKRSEPCLPVWNEARVNLRVRHYALAFAVLLGSVGCQSGGAGNPFQSAPTRIPAPPTRSLQPNGNYYNGPASTVPGTAPGAPGGAIGTGVTSGSNWSSNPNAVNATNSAGVYTSSLERSGTGYTVRTVPNGAAPPPPGSTAVPNPNTRSSAPIDPRYPTTTVPNPSYGVQPVEYQQPVAPPPASNQPYSNPRYGDPPPYVPPTDASLTVPPSNGSNLNWRTPRP